MHAGRQLIALHCGIDGDLHTALAPDHSPCVTRCLKFSFVGASHALRLIFRQVTVPHEDLHLDCGRHHTAIMLLRSG